MANTKFMDHKKGDRFDGVRTCPVCDGDKFTIFKVYEVQMQVKCSSKACGNIEVIERPLALNVAVTA